MITDIFLDLDNTLIDFNGCARSSMKKLFPEYGLSFKDEYFDTFLETNNALWRDIESGRLTRERLREIRWNTIFKKLGLSCDGVAFEVQFEQGIAEGTEPVDGAFELLCYLYPKYRLHIVTNGFASTQKNRLKKGGYDKYIDKVFISENIGVQKPQKGFFDACFKELQGVEPENCVLIGDSLTADISGGVSYGIKTIWFNRNGEAPTDVVPDYTVNALCEIKALL